MSVKIAAIILILGLSQLTNASFFGLFRSSKPTRKPDVVVSESPKSETDKNAYQNYLRSLASTYYAPTSPPVNYRYIPVYAFQPQSQLYSNYMQPQQNSIYQYTATAPRLLQTATVPIRYNYQPVRTNVDSSSVKFTSPITVLPSSSHEEAPTSSTAGNGNYNKLIEEPSSPVFRAGFPSINKKTHAFEIPEPQISASLYDLPVSGISPDFLTGGYVTKMMTVSPKNSNETRSGRKFTHAYDNGDGTKVSEEGELVKYGNGKETILKRGQYEYIDANRKAVLVKWVADDNGFRLVK